LLDALMAILVINLSLFFVAEHLVRFGYFYEPLVGRFISTDLS
jgi:hypothetical protein